ncbi:MAG TPA: acetylxylan esterase [Phycisphaerae bacterium]|nr:acetylxylan esterase [Phycisphaerae bacterium]
MSHFCAPLLLISAAAMTPAMTPATQPAADVRVAHIYSKDAPAEFKPDYVTRDGWLRRADFLRTQVLVAQGLWPMPPRTAINAAIYGKIDRGDFTVEKVAFQSLPGHYVTGNLYRPRETPGQKYPAVLVPYGHWPGGRFMWVSDADIRTQISIGAEKDPRAARSPLQASCAMLAKMGCIAFQWDLVGYCDSKGIEHQQGFLDADAVLRLQSFMGLQTWNSVRALDFISSLPDVDIKRIACTGASSGGTQTIQLEAIDNRLAATFPVVMVSMNMQGGCVCENAPLLRINTDNVELASLFAPKPQGMAADTGDWTHDFDTRGLPEMKDIYGLFNAANDVSAQVFPFKHNDNLHSRELMYTFINKYFNLGHASPVVEEPVDPLKPEQLTVWDADHPLPKDIADAKAVRAWMTETSDEALAALEKNAPAYDSTLRAALQAMVDDRAASVMDIDATMQRVPAGTTIRPGFIGRRNADERVPVTVLAPQQATGVAILWSSLDGPAALVSKDNTINPIAQQFLDKGDYVLAIGAYNSPSFPSHPDALPPTAKKSSNPPYSGYYNGYNRTTLANRIHDLLTAIAFARTLPGVLEVRVLGDGETAPAALLASALAPASITRAAFNLDQFDFDKVASDADPNFIPGARKYGGLYAFVPLLAATDRPLLLAGARDTGKYALAKNAPAVTLQPSAATPAQLAAFLSK